MGVGTALIVAVTILGPDVDPRLRADSDERRAETVEVPRPEADHRPWDTDDDTRLEALLAERRARRPPPCLAEDGSACADPLLGDADLASAVPVVFGAVVVDGSLTLRRLHMVGDRGAHVRWSAVPWGAGDGGDRSAAELSTPSRLERTGTTLLLGTPSHLRALGSIDGQQRWSTRLEEFGDGTTPWHGWVVDDAVIAANPSSIVILDADDGRVRWQLDGPFDHVLPLASGVAVLRAGLIEVFGPGEERARWTRSVDPPARFPPGTHPPNHGPIVVTTAVERTILDPQTGEVLAELGSSAVATRTTAGQIVATVWEDDGTAGTLVGFGIDGGPRWRADAPELPCCRVDLRPTADGHVIALIPGAAGTETGWVIDPTTGAVLQRITRPADVAWVPRAVVGSTVVWMDGAAFVATDPAGTPRWRAESQAGLLAASPLLLSTRDGLIRPPAAGPATHPGPRRNPR